MAFNPPSIQNMYDNKQLTSPLVQIVLLLVVIVLFSWFLVKPKINESTDLHRTLAAKKQQLGKLQSEKQELNRLISQMQDSAEDIKLLDEAVPLTGRVTKLNVLIENLAQSSGMQIGQLSADGMDEVISAGNKDVLENPYEAKRSLQTATVSVLLIGNIEQFRNFLELLETNGRILDVSSLDVVGGDAVTRFRVKLKAYAYEVK